jgi:putative endonuclease
MVDKLAKSTAKQTGDRAEAMAVSWLEERGHQVFGRNLYTPYGKIEILARKDKRLIFVEIKTRKSARFGLPEEANTGLKIKQVVESAEYYIQEHPDLDEDWQINVIAIQHDPKTDRTEFTHFENAV